MLEPILSVFQRAIDWINDYLARQSDVRRSGIMGCFFGLLMCVVVFLIILILVQIAHLGKG